MRSTQFTPLLGMVTTNSAGSTTHTLNTAYSFGTAANQALAIRFISPVTSTLTHAYFFVHASAGSVGNVLCEVRGYSSATVPAGGAASASQSVSWVGATKWLQVAFSSPASVVAGNAYFVVLGNADGTPGTNYPTIRIGFSGPKVVDNQIARFMSVTSTNGFSTGSVMTSGAPSLGVLKFADGTVIGNPYTAAGSYSSNQRRRGIKINALEKALGFNAMQINTAGNAATIEVYSGTTIPGGSLVRTADTLPASAITILSAEIPEIILSANTIYRVVMTFSGNSTAPGYWQIEDSGAFADVLLAGVGGGKIYSTISDGGAPEAWVDSPDSLPRMALAITQYGESGAGNVIVIED